MPFFPICGSFWRASPIVERVKSFRLKPQTLKYLANPAKEERPEKQFQKGNDECGTHSSNFWIRRQSSNGKSYCAFEIETDFGVDSIQWIDRLFAGCSNAIGHCYTLIFSKGDFEGELVCEQLLSYKPLFS